MARRRVLITGITGMVWLTSGRFPAREDRLGRHRYAGGAARWTTWATSPIASRDRVFLHYGDLRRDTMSDPRCRRQGQADYVFHLAAQSFLRTSFTHRSTPWTPTPGHARARRAEAAEHAPSAVIHVCASSEVFGRVPKEARSTRSAVPPRLALRHLSRHRPGRPLCRGLRHDGTPRMFTHTGRVAATCSPNRPSPSGRDDRVPIPPVVKVGT